MSEDSICGQCGKPSIARIDKVNLCVDCYHKIETIRIMQTQQNMAMINQALADMDAAVGFGYSPRIKIPEFPHGPVTNNNIKINGGNIGVINTGVVGSIVNNLSSFSGGNYQNLKESIEKLTQAVIDEESISPQAKNELIEQISIISEQAATPPESRKVGVIKPIFSALEQGASITENLANAWQAASPILKDIFGL